MLNYFLNCPFLKRSLTLTACSFVRDIERPKNLLFKSVLAALAPGEYPGLLGVIFPSRRSNELPGITTPSVFVKDLLKSVLSSAS